MRALPSRVALAVEDRAPNETDTSAASRFAKRLEYWQEKRTEFVIVANGESDKSEELCVKHEKNNPTRKYKQKRILKNNLLDCRNVKRIEKIPCLRFLSQRNMLICAPPLSVFFRGLLCEQKPV